MKKIIFIAGSPHSGSTLVNMLLGSHPNMAAFGEVTKLIDIDTRDRYLKRTLEGLGKCTCAGIKTKDCPFWAEFIKELSSNKSFGELYANLLEHTQARIGKQSAVVDSTKTLTSLKKLVRSIECGELPGITLDDLMVVHVIKDLRAFLKSAKVRYKLSDWNIPRLLWYALMWCKNNQQIEQFSHLKSTAYYKLGYENLCFSLDLELQNVCESIGCAYSPNMKNLEMEHSHIGHGNPKRISTSESKLINYDFRWFNDFGVNLAYLLSGKARKYNSRTYSDSKKVL